MKAKGTKVKILSGFSNIETLEDIVENFIDSLPDNTDVDVKYSTTSSPRTGYVYHSALIMYNTNEDEI